VAVTTTGGSERGVAGWAATGSGADNATDSSPIAGARRAGQENWCAGSGVGGEEKPRTALDVANEVTRCNTGQGGDEGNGRAMRDVGRGGDKRTMVVTSGSKMAVRARFPAGRTNQARLAAAHPLAGIRAGERPARPSQELPDDAGVETQWRDRVRRTVPCSRTIVIRLPLRGQRRLAAGVVGRPAPCFPFNRSTDPSRGTNAAIIRHGNCHGDIASLGNQVVIHGT
jgi:hypothetical protein